MDDTRTLMWCAAHHEPGWRYSDGSETCWHDSIVECCDVHTLVDLPQVARLLAWQREATQVLEDWEAVWEAAGKPGALGMTKAAGLMADLGRREEELQVAQNEAARQHEYACRMDALAEERLIEVIRLRQLIKRWCAATTSADQAIYRSDLPLDRVDTLWDHQDLVTQELYREACRD